MEHGRLPWLTPEELTDAQRVVYDSVTGGPRSSQTSTVSLTDELGRLHGPFNALLVQPDLGGIIQELGSALRYRTALPARTREIATLLVAYDAKSEFEWYAHDRLARASGVTEEEIEELHAGNIPGSLSDDERLICTLVETLLRSADLDDQLYAEATKQLGTVVVMEVVSLVGFYQLLAMILRVARTPLPEGEPLRF